jgi:hypothetical protein
VPPGAPSRESLAAVTEPDDRDRHARPPGWPPAADPHPRRAAPRAVLSRPEGPVTGPPLRSAPRPRRRAEPGGWLRRFVRRHGWRAYALPVLTVATLLTLVDVTATADGGERQAAVSSETTAAAGPPSPPAAPTSPAEG